MSTPKEVAGSDEQDLHLGTDFTILFGELSKPIDFSSVDNDQAPVGLDPSLVKGFPRQKKFIWHLLSLQLGLGEQSDPNQLVEKIQQVIDDHHLSVAVNVRSPHSILIRNYRYVRVFQDLGLESNLVPSLIDEVSRFEVLLSKVSSTLREKISNPQMLGEPQKILEQILGLISNGYTRSPAEVIEVFTHGPVVHDIAQALAGAQETLVLDDQVAQRFLRRNFSAEIFRTMIKIARVEGSNNYYWRGESGYPEPLSEEEFEEKTADLKPDEVSENILFSSVPAGTGQENWTAIQLYNMCLTKPEVLRSSLHSLDYLKSEWSPEVAVQIYSLGLLAHEFSHRLQTDELMGRYASIAKPSWNTEAKVWFGYPSEYVQSYVRNDEEDIVLLEDLADSVQIFVMNSAYLKEHYPERYEFIQKEFPYLQADSAAAAILAVKE